MGEPGGAGLCVKTCCCACLVIGDINVAIEGPGGYVGGCLGDLLLSCVDLYCVCPIMQGLDIAKKANIEESTMNAVLKGCCCCCCYTMQQKARNRYQEHWAREAV